MHRFYAEPGITGPNVPLSEEDARHASRVLRMKLGEPCEMFVDGKRYAASMNCMPHGEGSIKNNNFDGHYCIHFTNSRTHGSNKVDPQHQAAIQKALRAG